MKITITVTKDELEENGGEKFYLLENLIDDPDTILNEAEVIVID